MFGLFDSKRTKWKKKLIKGFDIYNEGLKGMDDEEIGTLLDQAARIKSASLLTLEENDPAKFFWEDPVRVDEKDAYDRLDFWLKWMIGWSQEGVMGNAKSASLQVFFYSLGAMTIIELRVRGKEMWKELSRGFSYCSLFSPKDDIPKGFEKINK